MSAKGVRIRDGSCRIGGSEGSPGVRLDPVKPRKTSILVWAALGALTGCAPSLQPRVQWRAASPGATVTEIPRIAWVVPEDRNRLRKPGDLQVTQDAATVLRDRFAALARRRGCIVVPSRAVDSMVTRSFAGRDLTDGQAAKVAQELGADFVVFGRLDAWARGSLFGRSTTVGFRLDVADREGTALARLSHAGTAAQEDPADLADSLAHQAMDSLELAWGGCAR